MTPDPIQHLRERMRDEPPISYMVEALELLPALLGVAEDMGELYAHDLGKTANSIVARALARLDEAKP